MKQDFNPPQDEGGGDLGPLETGITGKCADEPESDDYRQSVASVMRIQTRYVEAERYLECGRITRTFCPKCGFKDLQTRVHRCGLRECPECSQIEAKRIYTRIMREVRKIPPFPRWKWRHLVITSVRNPLSPIRDDYLKLKIGIKRLRAYFRRKEFLGKISAVGGCQFGPKNAMAHVHIAIFCPWLDLDAIQRVTGLGTVFVKVIKSAVQFYECVRYSANFTKSRDPCFLANMGLAMKGTRRIFTWGKLYGCTTALKKEKTDKDCPCCGARLSWEYVLVGVSARPLSGLSPGFAI